MSYNISRFIHIDRFRKSDKTLKPKLFKPEPNKQTNRLEVSCFNLDGLNPDNIKEIGDSIISNNKPPIGYCTANSIEFKDTISNVKIEKDDTIDRHFNIIDWPSEQNDLDFTINSLISLFGKNIKIYENL